MCTIHPVSCIRYHFKINVRFVLMRMSFTLLKGLEVYFVRFYNEGLIDHIVFESHDAKQKPDRWTIDFSIDCEKPMEFEFKFRIPWWISNKIQVIINDNQQNVKSAPSSFCSIKRIWNNDQLRIILPKAVTLCPLPGEPDTYAFMDGPVVLAGLCSETRTLYGNRNNTKSILKLRNEIQWGTWLSEYRTINQDVNIRDGSNQCDKINQLFPCADDTELTPRPPLLKREGE